MVVAGFLEPVCRHEFLVQPGQRRRLIVIAAADRLPPRSWSLLREALLAGSFARGDAPELTGYKERQARTVLNALLARGVLVSEGQRSRVRLGFPTDIVERWIPTLYPAAAGNPSIDSDRAPRTK